MYDAAKVDRVAELLRQRKAIDAELDSLVPSLTAGSPRGTILETDSNKLRVCSRLQLEDSKLQRVVSPSMWTAITERKTVAAFVQEKIKRGKLTQDLINSCSKETRRWLELR